jgi:hypothetical protein
MNQIMRALSTAVFFLIITQACKKSTPNSPVVTAGGTTNTIKTQISLAFDNNSGAVYDSLIINYYYNPQNSVTKITQWQWDNSSGTVVTDSNSSQFTYSQGAMTVLKYFNGNSNPSNQNIYYLDLSTSQLDSAVLQSSVNNVWVTTEKDVYSYDVTGYASQEIATTYDSLTGIVTNIGNSYFSWSSGNQLYDSTISSTSSDISVVTNTYYPNSNPVITNPGYAFKGLISTDILQSETITINGVILSTINISFTINSDNRFKSISTSLNGVPYTTDLFTYY